MRSKIKWAEGHSTFTWIFWHVTIKWRGLLGTFIFAEDRTYEAIDIVNIKHMLNIRGVYYDVCCEFTFLVEFCFDDRFHLSSHGISEENCCARI